MNNKYVIEDNCGTLKGEAQLFTKYTYEHLLENSYEQTVNKIKYKQSREIHENLQLTTDEMHDKLNNIGDNQEIIFNPQLSEHATIMKAKKVTVDGKDYIICSMFNTGDGLQYHDRQGKSNKYAIRKDFIIPLEDFKKEIVPLTQDKIKVKTFYQALRKFHQEDKVAYFKEKNYINQKVIYQAEQKLDNCALAVEKKMYKADFREEYGEILGDIKYYEDELRTQSQELKIDKYMDIYSNTNTTKEQKMAKMEKLFKQNNQIDNDETIKARVNKIFKLTEKIYKLYALWSQQ